jgi:hypothetical protein
MTTPVRLEEYKQAERETSQRQASTGFRIHAIVTVFIWAGVTLLNVLVATGFPWSIFVILGTGLGVFFHWYGYRHAEGDTRRQQDSLVQYAHTHSTTR